MPQGSHSVTVRAVIPAEVGMLGRVMAALGAAGGEVGAVDLVRSSRGATVRDITVYTGDESGEAALSAALDDLDGVEIESINDQIFLAHAGGKLGMKNSARVSTRDDLAMAYTPGVARVCMAIHDDFDAAWDYTIKGNSVMVVSDGSSVVGQGDLGPEAALPALEAKCMVLRELAGVDAFPLPVTARDPDEIAGIVERTSSVFAGVQLTDVAAPRCFTLRRTLVNNLDIPVFSDDQGGTAVALLAALTNGLKLAGKKLADARVVVSGLGPGGVATVRLLVAAGAGAVIACDSRGAVHRGRSELGGELDRIAELTNPDNETGDARTLVRGADAFIGLSVPGLLNEDDVRGMADDPVVLALAMPEPEVSPAVARATGAVYATGRPDIPNQINSAVAFPGIWRGMLDTRATSLEAPMLLAAAEAIAAIPPAESPLSRESIVPSVLNPDLVPAVAAAVSRAATECGVARVPASA